MNPDATPSRDAAVPPSTTPTSATMRKSWRHATLLYAIVSVCWAVYALLTLFAPPAANARFQMSEQELLLLRLTIIIPVHLIWILAARGAARIKYYASLIRPGLEAPGLGKIANGLLWTLAYLITVTLGGAILPFFRDHAAYDAFVVFRDHLAPLLAGTAFIMLYLGSQALKRVSQFPTWTLSTILLTLGFAIFAGFFVYEFSTAPENLSPTRTSLQILSHEVMLLTYIIPYILAWFIGLLAVINLAKYAARVKGVLYRRALQHLVVGISGIILFMITYQVLTFAVRFLINLNIGATLLVVYFILLLYGLGFIFVGSGAGKLMRIEAVR